MKSIIIGIFIAIVGCTTIPTASQEALDKAEKDYSAIYAEWQGRMKADREWTPKDIKCPDDWSTINTTFFLWGISSKMTYASDDGEHWATPRELEKARLHGDCEDISIFQRACLVYCEYPYEVWVLAVKGALGEHTVLEVEMENGQKWPFEPMPNLFDWVDRGLYQVIFRFTEEEVVWK